MRWLLTMVICLLATVPTKAQRGGGVFPDIPELVVSLSPLDVKQNGTYVQNQIVLQVRVVSRWPFEALNLQLPKLDHVNQIQLLRPRTTEAKTMAGNGYLHETAFALFPLNSGSLVIPSISVTGVASGPNGKIDFSHKSEEQVIPVKGIAPAFEEPWWLVSKRIEMSESWSKPVEEIRFGEVVRREVKLVAYGVIGEQLPAIQHNTTRGVTVSNDGQTTKTELTPTGVITYRTQAWTLKLEGSNFVYVPPLGIDYWDGERDTQMKSSVRGYRLEPLPADTGAIAARLMNEAFADYDTNRQLMITLVSLIVSPVVLVALFLLWLALPSRADIRLFHQCRRAEATATDKLRAVDEWAKESGLQLFTGNDKPSHLPASYLDLRSMVFGQRTVENIGPSLVWDLLAHARRMRFRVMVLPKLSAFGSLIR